MHLVHRNTIYTTMRQATNRRDGLLVVAVLFRASERNNRYLDFITDELDEIRRFNSSVHVDVRPLASIIPIEDAANLFYYQGSLTTPPCSQEVHWLIFPHQPPVGIQQLERFRRIRDSHRREVSTNFRRLQFINNRPVYTVYL